MRREVIGRSDTNSPYGYMRTSEVRAVVCCAAFDILLQYGAGATRHVWPWPYSTVQGWSAHSNQLLSGPVVAESDRLLSSLFGAHDHSFKRKKWLFLIFAFDLTHSISRQPKGAERCSIDQTKGLIASNPFPMEKYLSLRTSRGQD